MNSNSYLGMGLRPEVIAAEEEASRAFGAGPGAVRFISGTYEAHVELERAGRVPRPRGRHDLLVGLRHGRSRPSCPLTTTETVVISDELNHNCIINAMRLARPADKAIYPHNDMDGLERALEESEGRGEAGARRHRRHLLHARRPRAARRDHGGLRAARRRVSRRTWSGGRRLARRGRVRRTGRGTEEYTGAEGVDVLVGTLGKAFGVNGGYVARAPRSIRFLRETSPMYIYSNPITRARRRRRSRLEIVASPEGVASWTGCAPHEALRGRARPHRHRDDPGRAPRGAAHDPRHREPATGALPASTTACW
jgi:glycine C-acetyltransferase